MRGTAMLAIIGAIWLLTGLCWTTVALGGDVPMLGHGLPIPAPQRSRDLGPPLRLPVRMVRYIPLRPAVGGEIFHTVSFLLDYTGGPITLAADAGGTRHTIVDDQLTLRVTHPDGTTSEYQDELESKWHAPMDLSEHFRASYQYCSTLESVPTGTEQGSTDGPVQMRAPADVISLFGPGTNHVEAFILDGRGGLVASSPVWLALVRDP